MTSTAFAQETGVFIPQVDGHKYHKTGQYDILQDIGPFRRLYNGQDPSGQHDDHKQFAGPFVSLRKLVSQLQRDHAQDHDARRGQVQSFQRRRGFPVAIPERPEKPHQSDHQEGQLQDFYEFITGT